MELPFILDKGEKVIKDTETLWSIQKQLKKKSIKLVDLPGLI